MAGSKNLPHDAFDFVTFCTMPNTPAATFAVVFNGIGPQAGDVLFDALASLDRSTADCPGFLGLEHAHEPGGATTIVCHFETVEAIAQWQEAEAARESQSGMKHADQTSMAWHAQFQIQVCQIKDPKAFRTQPEA